MAIVTVSPKFQVVIPRDIRRALKLRPGQKVQAIHYRGRVELVPIKSPSQLRALLKGIDSDVQREDDRP